MVDHIAQRALLGLCCNMIMFGGVALIVWFVFDLVWLGFQIKLTMPDIVYHVSRPIIGIGCIVFSIILKNDFIARNPQISIG